jgi:nitronate monooxygenase
MESLTREELLGFLNLMLEAERAGAKALLHVSKDADRKDAAALAKTIHLDEAKWCALLTKAIRELDGTPSDKTGAFYEKVMAVPDLGERLALVNRGQEWVVRKLRDAIPRIADTRLADDLTVMLTSHEENIATVARSGLIG